MRKCTLFGTELTVFQISTLLIQFRTVFFGEHMFPIKTFLFLFAG